MDALLPGHAHRSSSDRLLNNYLTSQKSLNTSLLTLLSHSHSSTSSLLAYVTSSPGVHLPIRRAVKHAAFEGTHSDHSSHDEPQHHGPGWAAYVTSLETFRQDLKAIHQLEEELSRVKRDREILVTRLIKNTKSRPSKNDLAAVANGYTSNDNNSIKGSQLSVTSDGSAKESKRAGKLAEAQAELLGCEEHLRGLEVTIEGERNKVMQHGLADRFRAMDEVGRMWQHQARLGLQALERGPDADSLASNAYELDSNGSIAPSQSASQVGYDDQPVSPNRQQFPKHLNHLNGNNHGHGSITGSIAEEDEDGGSSGSDDGGNYVMHENRGGQRKSGSTATGNRSQATATGPRGVPSVNAPARPINLRRGSDGSDAGTARRSSGLFNSRSGGRRATSEVGMGYNPPKSRMSLRRTHSNDGASKKRGGSDAGSSVGSYKKRKGFFSAIKGFFKGKGRSGSSIRSGRDSPPYGSPSVGRSGGGGWQTRTDANVKRATSMLSKPSGGSRRRGGDDSSSDEDDGNLVAVQNVGKDRWAVDNNSSGSKPKAKRQSSGSSIPIASGLIPAPRPTRSDLGAGSRATSTSTITPRTAGASITKAPASSTPSRSNTVKSTASNTKRNRKNGSIARATSTGGTTGRTIMSLVDADKANEGPKMIDIPTAPRSQVIPSLTLAKAPGSALVLPSQMSKPERPSSGYAASVTPSQSISQLGHGRKDQDDSDDEDRNHLRPVTPSLPPSRSLSPPLKSAMRPSSPAPSPQKPDWTSMEAPKMTSVTAPGRVTSDAPPPAPAPAPAPEPEKATEVVEKPLAADDASIYESAREDDDDEDDDAGSSDGESFSNLKIVENDRHKRAPSNDIKAPGSSIPEPEVEEEHSTPKAKNAPLPELAPPVTAPGRVAPSVDGSEVTADGEGAKVRRRKSVRMNVPDTPDSAAPNPLQDQQAAAPAPAQREAASSWSTRIGKSKDESSDEEGAAYVKAKRNLSRNSGKWETVNGEKVRKKNKA